MLCGWEGRKSAYSLLANVALEAFLRLRLRLTWLLGRGGFCLNFLRVGKMLELRLDQLAQNCEIDVIELLDVHAALGCLDLSKFLHELVEAFECLTHAVEHEIALARRESDPKDVPLAAALVDVMVIAEPDHGRPP